MSARPSRQAPAEAQAFASRLLDWWQAHGRHDLPWQQNRSPYRVWLSEIMLQQTQVSTVIPYFERFTQRFPSLTALAMADSDDVMALWSGLGYYARARNLLATARLCLAQHNGELPDEPDALEALPGIGRSTANAIVAQAHDRRAVILDGNVKRVMARHAAIEGWPGQTAVAHKLWEAAEQRTPENQARDYTQAIMDLGATLCRRSQPQCEQCPVAADCLGRQRRLLDQLPGRRPKKQRPTQRTHMLLIRDSAQRLLLEKRPPSGIWGGLWCLPMSEQSPPDNIRQHALPGLVHQFSHFSLEITPLLIEQNAWPEPADRVADTDEQAWISLDEALNRGLPRPVQRLLESIQCQQI